MAEEEPKPLAYVPEVVLKKRKNNEEWAIRRRAELEQRLWRNKENRKNTFKRAEQFVEERRKKDLDLIQMKHRKKRRKTTLTAQSKLLFIIRIRGKNDMHPKTRKILGLLRLRRVFTGAFVKVDEGTMQMLQEVEPYVAYGYPNLSNVKNLIYKKGFARLDKKRVPLTDNNIIEQALGKHGIICMEDIVHEIANVGPHFKDVTGFLWPFTLNKPEGGFQRNKKSFKDGGDAGNREDLINELISKMN